MININETNKKDCCGCTACYSVCPKGCITMTADKEGFKYPVVNTDLCINCSMCDKVCPIQKDKPADEITEAYITRHKDMNIVMNSSSGGAFTAFSKTAFDEGAIVCGGAFDENYNVIHDFAYNEQESEKFRKSKYVQSDLQDSFKKIKELLKDGKKVLFSGSPCQCAGLNSYLQKKYDNLIIVDFVCHAVPSPLVWEKYREFVTNKYSSEITSVNFRSKVYGYHCSSMHIDFSNGKSRKNGLSTDQYMKSFFKDLSCRPSCYDCSFKTIERYADITMFDCWNITRYVPDKKDDDKGYTAVILHSQKGKDFFEKASDKLYVYNADLDTLIKTDGKLAVKSISKNPLRDKYFELLNSGLPLDKVVEQTIPISKKKKIINSSKNILHKTHLLGLMRKLK